jgi:hypothetical protein
MAGLVEYIGDGVYARFDGYAIGLSVGDHRDEPVVWLEPSVMSALNRFAEKAAQTSHCQDLGMRCEQ